MAPAIWMCRAFSANMHCPLWRRAMWPWTSLGFVIAVQPLYGSATVTKPRTWWQEKLLILIKNKKNQLGFHKRLMFKGRVWKTHLPQWSFWTGLCQTVPGRQSEQLYQRRDERQSERLWAAAALSAAGWIAPSSPAWNARHPLLLLHSPPEFGSQRKREI